MNTPLRTKTVLTMALFFCAACSNTQNSNEVIPQPEIPKAQVTAPIPPPGDAEVPLIDADSETKNLKEKTKNMKTSKSPLNVESKRN